MNRQENKEELYNALIDLTRNHREQNRYFSPRNIQHHASEIAQGKMFKEGTLDWTRVPTESHLYSNLDELVEEGKAEKVIGENSPTSNPYNFYRAILTK